MHISGNKTKRANLDIVKGLEMQLLLEKRLHIILMANI